MAIFQNSLRAIERLNNLEEKAVFGVNEFADLTPLEFRHRYLGYRKSATRKYGRCLFSFFSISPSAKFYYSVTNVMPPLEVDTVPTSIDWASAGATTPVYNQGQCGRYKF